VGMAADDEEVKTMKKKHWEVVIIIAFVLQAISYVFNASSFAESNKPIGIIVIVATGLFLTFAVVKMVRSSWDKK
jgi:hypothetical protein